MIEFKDKADAASSLGLMASQLLDLIPDHDNGGRCSVQHSALEVCVRHLSVNLDLLSAHLNVSNGVDQAMRKPFESGRPVEASLCLLLTMALEHPSVGKFWKRPVSISLVPTP